MRLWLDENIDARLAELLRSAGHDVVRAPDPEMQGAEDDALLKACAADERILVTLDLGFASVLLHPPNGTPGIVVLRVQDNLFMSVRAVVEALARALAKESPADRTWIVETDRLRVRGEAD